MVKYKKNTKGYKIKTDRGYLEFSGIAYMGDKPVWRITTESGNWIECTDDHRIYYQDQKCKTTREFLPGDSILTSNGTEKVSSIEETGKIEKVYDVIDVCGINRFYGNDILVSNCKFIIFSETLINQMKLATLEGIQPIRKTGQVRWYKKIEKNKTYLLSLDPSLGTGSDNAAIQVFELPTFVQVAEWQHNKTPIEGQMRVVMDVLKEIHEAIHPNLDYSYSSDEIYWTVESNTLGEAALLVIRDTGEENFPGTFLSDKVGKRKGYCTTNKVKLQACSKLKDMVEKDKITIRSKNLISELKNFVAKSNTFEGKDGEKDDLVSALLLIVRMALFISKWDTITSGVLSGNILYEEEGRADPMPMLVL